MQNRLEKAEEKKKNRKVVWQSPPYLFSWLSWEPKWEWEGRQLKLVRDNASRIIMNEQGGIVIPFEDETLRHFTYTHKWRLKEGDDEKRMEEDLWLNPLLIFHISPFFMFNSFMLKSYS